MNGKIIPFSLTVLLILCLHVEQAHSKCNARDYSSDHPSVPSSAVCVCSDQEKCIGDFSDLTLSSNANVATLFKTTKEGARFARNDLNIVPHVNQTRQGSNQSEATLDITVNSRVKFQKILGFGGAFTDAVGYNIVKLPKHLQERLIRDYFAPEGLGYTLGRIVIGGCDFSLRNYSYDDLKSGEEDESLDRFSLQAEDFAYKLPLLRLAQQVSNNSVKFFGSAWTAPAWMKTNNELVHGGLLRGEPGGKYYKSYARYLARFFHEYHKQEVDVWGLTIVNEPQFGWVPSYVSNSLGFTGQTQRDFIKLDLGPEFERSQLADKKVMIFDDNVPHLQEFATAVLSDSEASKYVAGVAFHWYDNRNASTEQILDNITAKFADKFFLSTEACEWTGQDVRLGKWATLVSYAWDVIGDLNHGAVGWVDWNLVLDLHSGPSWVGNKVDAPIIVNGSSGEYYKQPSFYALGHFAKFLVPGSVRVKHQVSVLAGDGVMDDSTKLTTDVHLTVFERPDGRKVLTLVNTRNAQVRVRLQTDHGSTTWSVEPLALHSVIFH